MQFTYVASLLLAGLAAASPIERRAGVQAVDQILEISPKSQTCDGSKDCRTAEQAAPLLIQAFQDYKDLLGRPDRRCPCPHGLRVGGLQMYPNNIKYAQAIPELQSKASAYTENSPDDKKNELLALVTDDKYNFGSGPWYLTTQCDKGVQTALAAGDDAGFAAYMKCVGVTVTEDRNAYWQRAKKAFSL
ncbi:hypothetical protein PG987_014795 [Apiospora arundinis]